MTSRKEDLVIRIALKRSKDGMPIDEVRSSTQGYYRKKVAELQEILNAEYALDQWGEKEARNRVIRARSGYAVKVHVSKRYFEELKIMLMDWVVSIDEEIENLA